jgi:membrane associated rhomboid family serine protease
VEDDLGSGKYLLFLGFVIVTGALISTLISGGRDVPHIGFSGVVMALFAYYGLQFPKAKLIWLLPGFGIVRFGSLHTSIFGWSWFQFRALWVALFYLGGDIAYYYLMERTDTSSISFSGHIAHRERRSIRKIEA